MGKHQHEHMELGDNGGGVYHPSPFLTNVSMFGSA